MKCNVILLCFSLLAASALGDPTSVTLTMNTPPPFLAPGRTATIAVDFQKGLAVAEKRLVFVCELRRIADESVIVQAVLDNGQQGYTESEGMLTFSMPIPPAPPAKPILPLQPLPGVSIAPFFARRIVIPPTEPFLMYGREADTESLKTFITLGLLSPPRTPGTRPIALELPSRLSCHPIINTTKLMGIPGS